MSYGQSFSRAVVSRTRDFSRMSMNTLTLSLLLGGSIAATAVFAAPPPGAPSGSMGMCKDGTYSSSAEKKGACRGHQGVKDWYATDAMKETSPQTGHESSTTPSTPTTMSTPTAKMNSSTAAKTSSAPMTQPAAGGGAGKVWANTSTKVYHCSGDKYYGTTKHGEYMAESDAKTKGFHADHGKACG